MLEEKTKPGPSSGESMGTRPSSPTDPVAPQLGWRLPVALLLFGVAIACPLVGTAILSADFSSATKAVAGLMFFPIPEVFDLSAIAVLGKPGFDWLKTRLRRFFTRFAPSDEVSRVRYRVGLVMFTVPVLFGWLHPYFEGYPAAIEEYQGVINVSGDLLFVTSFFVLGGDFWDKVRALFVHGARAQFPRPESRAAASQSQGDQHDRTR